MKHFRMDSEQWILRIIILKLLLFGWCHYWEHMASLCTGTSTDIACMAFFGHFSYTCTSFDYVFHSFNSKLQTWFDQLAVDKSVLNESVSLVLLIYLYNALSNRSKYRTTLLLNSNQAICQKTTRNAHNGIKWIFLSQKVHSYAPVNGTFLSAFQTSTPSMSTRFFNIVLAKAMRSMMSRWQPSWIRCTMLYVVALRSSSM